MAKQFVKFDRDFSQVHVEIGAYDDDESRIFAALVTLTEYYMLNLEPGKVEDLDYVHQAVRENIMEPLIEEATLWLALETPNVILNPIGVAQGREPFTTHDSIREMSSDTVRREIEEKYEGGWDAFVRSCYQPTYTSLRSGTPLRNQPTEGPTEDDIRDRIVKAFPFGHLDIDNEGQYIVYTNIFLNPSTGAITEHDDSVESSPTFDGPDEDGLI